MRRRRKGKEEVRRRMRSRTRRTTIATTVVNTQLTSYHLGKPDHISRCHQLCRHHLSHEHARNTHLDSYSNTSLLAKTIVKSKPKHPYLNGFICYCVFKQDRKTRELASIGIKRTLSTSFGILAQHPYFIDIGTLWVTWSVLSTAPPLFTFPERLFLLPILGWVYLGKSRVIWRLV